MQRAISFDRVASVYDSTRALPPALQSFAVDRLREEIGDSTLLDIGVGTGRFAFPLQRAGVAVVGCDVSPEMLRTGIRKGLVGAVRTDARRLPLRSGAFDVAMTTHLLHLVPEWTMVLREISRVARRSYVSVLERSTEVPDLTEDYRRLTAPPGLPAPAARHGERELAENLPPDRTVRSEEVVRRLPCARSIEELEQRWYSSTFQVPEPAHRAAILHLKERHGTSEVTSTTHVEVVAWAVARLAPFSEGVRSPGPGP
jgi:ubiquinone/menaquinone biosynthesis C-methylase UbiE